MKTEDLNQALVAPYLQKAELHTLTLRRRPLRRGGGGPALRFRRRFQRRVRRLPRRGPRQGARRPEIGHRRAAAHRLPAQRPALGPLPKEGVWVDSEKYPGKEARITLIPNPVRIMLTVGKQAQQELWKA
ncbi:MAG: hypothetical protein WKG07_15875 [Hymenobacter sp.]